jgi:hypothetical protein
VKPQVVKVGQVWADKRARRRVVIVEVRPREGQAVIRNAERILENAKLTTVAMESGTLQRYDFVADSLKAWNVAGCP